MPTIIINELQLACMNICWIKNVVTTQSELILKYTTDFIKNAGSSLTVNKEYALSLPLWPPWYTGFLRCLPARSSLLSKVTHDPGQHFTPLP